MIRILYNFKRNLKAPLTFILVMMVLLFKTCIDLLEQCVIKIGKKTQHVY